MEISHEQAHKLVQQNIDQALSSEESSVLSAHLRACANCQEYAREIKEVDQLLFPLLKQQWNRQPIPLSSSALLERNQKISASYLLTIRKTALGLVILALFFSAWQFVLSYPGTSRQLPLIAPPVPTPSALRAQSTNTMIAHENCQSMLYLVQDGDTLSGIAAQFSVSEQELMEVNGLKAETVTPAMELTIPLCTFTPTGTSHAATFTPVIKPFTSTPGG